MPQTPLPPAPGVAEVKMIYVQDGQTMENVYHVHRSDGWDAVSLEELAVKFIAWEGDHAGTYRSGDVALMSLRLTDLSASDGAYLLRPVEPPIAGLLGSQALPANVTIALQLATGKRGRGRQGRAFWIGLTEGQVIKNLMDATQATNIMAAMGDLKTAIEEGPDDSTWVVLHRKHAGAYSNPATWDPVISAWMADLVVDSQKNRLPNHRRRSRRRTP